MIKRQLSELVKILKLLNSKLHSVALLFVFIKFRSELKLLQHNHQRGVNVIQFCLEREGNGDGPMADGCVINL